MKNIIYKLSLVLTLFIVVCIAKAQLPLVYGDAVVTHSSYGAGIVLRTLKTNNTIGAPLGTNWNTAAMAPVGSKPANWSAPNWVQGTLGSLYGITLDNQPNPNIYVSSSQIYSGSSTNASKVWRLDGVTGVNTLVFDFTNKIRSLGNLKYQFIGSKENIYVSNWDNGSIERLNGNSAGSVIWSKQTAFNPKFGLQQNDPNLVPYGLAVRNIGAGAYRLYYAKISIISPYSTNEIYSVDLDPDGAFLPATEVMETKPGISTAHPIADIAFTADGNRMLVGQQTWYGFASLSAHNSKVVEFKFSTGHVWNNSTNLFPSGTGANTNCVGGVSYSNNIINKGSSNFACDTTVWFTSDYINFTSGNYVYGVQGMGAGGGSLANSIWIDEDDNLNTVDKMQLGDIEVYKKPLECVVCACGKWQTGPTLNGVLIPGVTDNPNPNKSALPSGPGTPIGFPVSYPIQFVQGNVSGVINAVYHCTGNCGATYSWSIVSASGVGVATGAALPIDLSAYNSLLKCGNYNLIIKTKCGSSNCESLVLPITIICEPPSCCKADIKIDLIKNSVTAATNIPNHNAYSIDNLSMNLNFSIAMSEVRVNVEEFRLVANSPNCLNCNNRPVTWGNILSASLNGTGMALSGMVAPPTGSLPADYREAVYNTGGLLMPPSAILNLSLSLPAVTELTCCEVSAFLCLKFTFKDAQCRECVQMFCGNIKLIPATKTHKDVQDEINSIDAKSYKVDH